MKYKEPIHAQNENSPNEKKLKNQSINQASKQAIKVIDDSKQI